MFDNMKWNPDPCMCIVYTVKTPQMRTQQIYKTYLVYSKTLLIQINWGLKLSGLVKV